MARKKTPLGEPYPERTKDVWVTQSMLYATRDELKEDIKALKHEMNSKFEDMKLELVSLRSQMLSQFEQVNARFSETDAKIYRMFALHEEQNARNAVVLDGLTSLFFRQDRVEKRVDDVEKTIADFRR